MFRREKAESFEQHGLIPASELDLKIMVNLVTLLSMAYLAIKLLFLVPFYGYAWTLVYHRYKGMLPSNTGQRWKNPNV